MRNYGSFLHAEEFDVTFFSRLIIVTTINLYTMNSLYSSRIRIDVSMSKKKQLCYSTTAKKYRLLFSKNIAATRDSGIDQR